MYIVDITRGGTEDDVLLGKDSMDAKRKTIKYITDYVFANHNIYLDKDILDQGLNMIEFSLKDFMNSNYQKDIDDDLLIISTPTNMDYTLYVKYYDEKMDKYPRIYLLHNSQEKFAKKLTSFFINDYLIRMHRENLKSYERRSRTFRKDNEPNYFVSNDFICGTVSLNKGKYYNLVNSLLNEDTSMKQIRHSFKGKINL